MERIDIGKVSNIEKHYSSNQGESIKSKKKSKNKKSVKRKSRKRKKQNGGITYHYSDVESMEII